MSESAIYDLISSVARTTPAAYHCAAIDNFTAKDRVHSRCPSPFMFRKCSSDQCHSLGGSHDKHSSRQTRIKGNMTIVVVSLLAHPQRNEVGSRRLSPAPVRRGHLAALQTIREHPHLQSQCRLKS
jgi:hypothetical protein